MNSLPATNNRDFNPPLPFYRSGYTKVALFALALLLAGGAVGSHFGGLGIPGIVAFGGAGGIVGLIALALFIPCRTQKNKTATLRNGQEVDYVRNVVVRVAFNDLIKHSPARAWALAKKCEDPDQAMNEDTKEVLRQNRLLNAYDGVDPEVKAIIKEEMEKLPDLRNEFDTLDKLLILRKEHHCIYLSLWEPEVKLTPEQIERRPTILQKYGLTDDEGHLSEMATKVYRKYIR